MGQLSPEILGQNDGKEGRKAFVAVNGKVYDVSSSRLWKDGKHMVHLAGRDLSDDIMIAPHTIEKLTVFPIVGEFAMAPKKREGQLSILFRKHHPHPALVHFPVALFVFSAVFFAIFLYTKRTSFERTSYHLLAFATLTSPFAVISGLMSWALHYQSAFTRIFALKITGSMMLMAVGAATLWLRTSSGWTLIDPTAGMEKFAIYSSAIAGLALLVLGVAYLGGKISRP